MVLVGRFIMIMVAPSRLVRVQRPYSVETQHPMVGRLIILETSRLVERQPHSLTTQQALLVGRFIMVVASRLVERQHSLTTQQALLVGRLIMGKVVSYFMEKQYSVRMRHPLVVRFVMMAPSHLIIKQHSQTTQLTMVGRLRIMLIILMQL